MKTKLLLNALIVLWMSYFLTAASAFAQAHADRRATVQSAFENLLPVIYFLSGSDPFLSQLSPDEHKQFLLLGNYLIKRRMIFGPPPVPGQYNTSNHINFKLKFSDRSEDFKLNPGEPERTAKVTDDVWFNLKIINNSANQFHLLDAFQILIHEFGHKLGPEKDQTQLDQMAAKLKTYLRSFTKDHEIQAGLKATTLILPQVLLYENPMDMQPEPIVILERLGQSLQVHIDAARLAYTGVGYRDAKSTVQSYGRVTMIPKFHVQEMGLIIEWQTEKTNFLIAAQKFNYLDLAVNLNKAKDHFALTPFTESRTFYQLISPEKIQTAQPSARIQPQLYAVNVNYYRPTALTKWAEKLKVKGNVGGRIQLEAVIESAEPLKEVALLAQQKNGIFHFPGEASLLTGSFYRVQFSIPESSALSGPLRINGLALNGTTEWSLDEQLKLDLKPAPPTEERRLRAVEVWNGEAWLPADKMTEPTVSSAQIKFRLTVQDTGVLMDHLRIEWLVDESIFLKDGIHAKSFRRILDIIPGTQLRQTRRNGDLIIEVESRKAAQALPAQKSPLGYFTEDSGFRSFERLEFVDQRNQPFALPMRLVPQGWKSIFLLPKKPATVVRSCNKVHVL